MKQIHQLIALFVAFSCNGIFASAGWIDSHTPEDKLKTKSLVDGLEYELVMSDEFSVPNRTFNDGHDSTWTSLDKPDADANSAGGGSLHFYNSSQITTTEEGYLKITPITEDKVWNQYDPVLKQYNKSKTHFKSGMLQSWNKFCFTGGIVEVDVILPGSSTVGGLWPAIWLMGNLGRATYLASTNNVWPWSYNVCDRDLQGAQVISACNVQNHFGLHPSQGRGATEIDIIEAMAGDAKGQYYPETDPPIILPYADLTLQVAPGIKKYRPTPGYQPRPREYLESGNIKYDGSKWYRNLGLQGNTSINPFFYGTFLGKTKPEEPVQRGKHQEFQADALSAMHQMSPDQFETMHTVRLEWQPGPGGSLDWFVEDRQNTTASIEGENGKRWIRAFSIKDESLNEAMGSQIPIEPSYLIMNVAISSAWGFPFKLEKWCTGCYDCADSKCQCSFQSGFCEMMEKNNVDMLVDHVRVYQNKNNGNHTVGCDTKDYPSREYILGHEGLYSRSAPFSYEDRGPIKKVQKGGAECIKDSDCGGIIAPTTESSKKARVLSQLTINDKLEQTTTEKGVRGICVVKEQFGLFSSTVHENVCKCNHGFTGPRCLSFDHKDDEPGALELKNQKVLFDNIPGFWFPRSLVALGVLSVCLLVASTLANVKHMRKLHTIASPTKKPLYQSPTSYGSTQRSTDYNR